MTPLPSNAILHTILVHVLTAWDRKESKTKWYNPFALGMYFQAADSALAAVEAGATWREALQQNFTNRGRHNDWSKGFSITFLNAFCDSIDRGERPRLPIVK